uniref:MIP-T3_C domain-containing protein n=1 Tax=Heligmosomoides polygyrus TaxID=6339 RepID=A0A8L8Q2Z0_HELPZ
LVQKMIDTTTELKETNLNDAGDVDEVAFNREKVVMEAFSNSLQSVTRTTYPLSRIFDFAQEDLELMIKELEKWRSEAKKCENALKEKDAQGIGDAQMLSTVLASLDEDVKSMRTQVNATKSRINATDRRIQEMLNNLATRRSSPLSQALAAPPDTIRLAECYPVYNERMSLESIAPRRVARMWHLLITAAINARLMEDAVFPGMRIPGPDADSDAMKPSNYPAFLLFHDWQNCFAYTRNASSQEEIPSVSSRTNPTSSLGHFRIRSCENSRQLYVQVYGCFPFTYVFVNRRLADLAKFRSNEEVILEHIQPTICTAVEIVPLSQHDYEILVSSSPILEGLYLKIMLEAWFCTLSLYASHATLSPHSLRSVASVVRQILIIDAVSSVVGEAAVTGNVLGCPISPRSFFQRFTADFAGRLLYSAA